MTLVDVTSKNSMILFKNMHLPDDFLEFPADQWKPQSSFNDTKSFISLMAITNNYAECGIALIESFSGQFTKDEEQLQFGSQVVANHGKKFPEFLKQTLLNDLELHKRQQSIWQYFAHEQEESRSMNTEQLLKDCSVILIFEIKK